MLLDSDFRKFSRIPKNGFVSRAECFIACPGRKRRLPKP